MPHMVKREGIRDLTLEDIRTAAMAGSPFRLVSQATNRKPLRQGVALNEAPCN